MTTPGNKTVRCSEKYLRVRFTLELGLALVFATVFVFIHWVIGIVLFLLFVPLIWFRNRCLSMYRFTFGNGEIRTRKVFTNHVDVTTPIHQIQSVAAYEGILEGLLGAGTIEITTGSSHSDNARYLWPHIHDAQRIADELRVFVASKN